MLSLPFIVSSFRVSIRNCTVWPILFLLNVSLLLKELTFIFIYDYENLHNENIKKFDGNHMNYVKQRLGMEA